MNSSLLVNKITLVQKEYKELLLSLLQKLKTGHVSETLDEINIFWLRNIDLVQLYLKHVFSGQDSYVFSAATYLDYDNYEYIPFLMVGKKHILDDPLSRFSEICNNIFEFEDTSSIIKLIVQIVEDNIKVLENINDSIIILPLMLLSQSKKDVALIQNSEKLFLSLFENINSLEEYNNKCNSIDDIIHYARKDISNVILFSETDNLSSSFQDRFKKAIQDSEYFVDPADSDGCNFLKLVFGSIFQALSILTYCIEYRCIPYIRYPVSIHYIKIISNNVIDYKSINVILFKMSVAFALYNLCDLDYLAKIDSGELLGIIESYNFNEKIYNNFNKQDIIEDNNVKYPITDIVNKELELFYKYISENSQS